MAGVQRVRRFDCKKMKKLVINERLPRTEIVHFADRQRIVGSYFNQIWMREQETVHTARLPLRWWEPLSGGLRLARRALRQDKCNIFIQPGGVTAIRAGVVYHLAPDLRNCQPVLRLRNCRNILHQSFCVTPDGQAYFGEYGANRERTSVPVHHSSDGGKSWNVVFEFPAGSIKHVHGCYYDRFEDSLWVCTGDYAGENRILRTDRHFKNQEWIGDGSQKFRTCNFFFTNTAVHWLMDSQLEQSFAVRLDRRTRAITVGQPLPGPVWYIKELADGYYLAGTAQEIGPGVRDGHAHLLVSRDLERWEDLHLFQHDGWPKRYFKFGVLGFADGVQSSADFPVFFEALAGVDGQSVRCSLADTDA